MKISTYLVSYFEKKAKRDALVQLRLMPTKQLLDCGISPELLKEGVAGWPWRTQTETIAPLRFDHNADLALYPNERELNTVPASENDSVSQEVAA